MKYATIVKLTRTLAIIPITLILVVIFYLGGEIIDGIRNTDSVSQLTHVVGGVLGMIFGFLYRGGRRR